MPATGQRDKPSYSDEEVAVLARTLQACDDLPPDARQAVIDALPPQHARLRPVLAAMLDTPPEADDAPRWQLPALPMAPPAAPGQCIGPYRLLRPVGEGGMATVWLAERADGAFERRVALKLPRVAGSPALVARIEREKHIAARLEHPNIARFYDAGVWAGQPFIAMEYVDGMPIEQWCSAPGRSVAQVLQLFVAVARAVDHAHRRQVVHRDIKPANIVVDGQGRPCLLDFGIATLVDGEAAGAGALTQEFGRAMTRRYASPEQVLGQPVRPASDVYSLGVTLFELLAGSGPYAPGRDTPAALEEAIVQGVTVPAAARRPALRGDVEAILAKALQREPARRYASAGALADDLECHLAGRPVAARTLRWPQRLWRRVRAHRPALALGGGAALALMAAAVLVAQRVTRDDAALADEREVTAFVAELLRAHVGQRASAQPVEDLVAARFGGRPALHAELLRSLASAYLEVGASRQAGELAARHLALLERDHAPPPQLARALVLMGQASSAQSRHAQGIAHLQRAVALLPADGDDMALFARASLALYLVPAGRLDEARTIVAQLAAARPLERRPPSAGLARLTDVQGALLELDNRFDEALAHWQRAAAIAVQAEGPASREAVRIRVRMALDLVGRNRLADALPVLQQATNVMRGEGVFGEVRAAVVTARLMNNAFYMGLVAPAPVQAALQQATTAAAAAGPMLPPSVLANVEVLQGAVAMRRGDLTEARRLLAHALPVARAGTDGLVDRRWLVTYEAAVAMHSGRHEEAGPLLRERLQLRVSSGAGRSPFAAFDWVQLSHNAVMQGDLAEAEAVLRQAPDFAPLQGAEGRGGQAAYAQAIAEQWVRLRLRQGDAAAALAALPPDYGTTPEEDRSESTLAPYALRGEVLCAARRPAEGQPYLERSIASVATIAHLASPGLARLRALWGLCRLAQGDPAQAAAAAREARQAFTDQPEVSAWYRLPLERLERALDVRR